MGCGLGGVRSGVWAEGVGWVGWAGLGWASPKSHLPAPQGISLSRPGSNGEAEASEQKITGAKAAMWLWVKHRVTPKWEVATWTKTCGPIPGG